MQITDQLVILILILRFARVFLHAIFTIKWEIIALFKVFKNNSFIHVQRH